MNAALSLGGRHALDTVHTALVTKLSKDGFARNPEDRFLESTKFRRTGFEVLSLQSRRFCIAMIHPGKIGGEDSGFVAACPGANFHDCVALFRLVRRQQRDLKVAFKIGDAFFELRNFIVRSEEHTSELQSRRDLVCRLLLEKK